MEQCPSCRGSVEPDPEHVGVVRCMSCWGVWVLPRERCCPGYRPALMPALRTLEDFRGLRR